MGNIIVSYSTKISTVIFVFSILTAVLLQILSNLANDYGDTLHGADSKERIGPQRTVQSGKISKKEMLSAIITFAILSFVSGFLLLIFSYKNIGIYSFLIFLSIGISSIWAAYAYTSSKKPYGYKGLGDLFVFVFFGIVAVVGVYFLQTATLNFIVFFPAFALGFLSTAVLNLNNIRDIENDKINNKITIPVKIGFAKAKIYHLFLILSSLILLLVFSLLIFENTTQYLFLAPLLILVVHITKVLRTKTPEKFYPFLPKLSITIFIIVLGFWLGCLVF